MAASLARYIERQYVNSRGSILIHQTGLIVKFYISFAAFKMEKVSHIKKQIRASLSKKDLLSQLAS